LPPGPDQRHTTPIARRSLTVAQLGTALGVSEGKITLVRALTMAMESMVQSGKSSPVIKQLELAIT
jgi:hypothetical protein